MLAWVLGRGGCMRIIEALKKRLVERDVIKICDEYTTVVNNLVKGWLEPGNLHCFKYCLDKIPIGSSVVEIGAFQGLSTIILAHYSGGRHKIFNCDKWLPDVGVLDSMYKQDIDCVKHKDFLKTSYMKNVSYFCKKPPNTFEMLSDEFFEKWDANAAAPSLFYGEVILGGDIGFCFIDGSHTYDQTKKDFMNTDRHLITDGFILFDDSADYSSLGCHKFVKELQKDGRYRLIMKNPNYLFQKIT